tara:strand:- start:415 stop:531 length:117 start_codon:yes stop_codon:yes gene_type:complete
MKQGRSENKENMQKLVKFVKYLKEKEKDVIIIVKDKKD